MLSISSVVDTQDHDPLVSSQSRQRLVEAVPLADLAYIPLYILSRKILNILVSWKQTGRGGELCKLPTLRILYLVALFSD